MDTEPQTQFHITMPKSVKADAYRVAIEIHSLCGVGQYDYGCGFDRQASPDYKAEALTAGVKEMMEISMLTQQLLDVGAILGDDGLSNLYGGEDADCY